MAVGTYGTTRPSDVSPDDVEIILNYTPSRDETNDFVLTKLNASTLLRPYYNNQNTGGNANVEILGGLYNMTLPTEVFNKLGIYTLYIRPAQIRCLILDCGVLSALPNVRGIIIDINTVPSQYRNKFISQGLVGYRIEYLNSDGTKIPNFFRLITSSFFCEPVVQNLTNSSAKAIRYRYTDNNTNLVFCTLTPSTAPTNKPNAIPYIGQPQVNMIEGFATSLKGVGYLKLYGNQLLENWDIAMEFLKTNDAREFIKEQGIDEIINYIRLIEKAESHYVNGEPITNKNRRNSEEMKPIFPCASPSASAYFLRSLFHNSLKMIIDMTFFIDICKLNGDYEATQEEMKQEFMKMLENQKRNKQLSNEDRAKKMEEFVEKLQNIKLDSIINIDCIINTIVNGVTFSSILTFIFLLLFVIFFFVKL